MRVEVNPIKCEAHGLCAELLPEHITLDEWGYPLINGDPVPRALEELARRAANVCPTLALSLRPGQLPEARAPARRPAAPPPQRSVRPSRELRDQRRRQHEPGHQGRS
jgi:ferredoxin